MNRPMYWDRAGEPIGDVLEWARLFENPGYRFVAIDEEGDRMISTIWQGLDVCHGRLTEPMPYESGVFDHGSSVAVDLVPWPSEEAAVAGHALLCRELLGRDARPEDGRLQTAIDLSKEPRDE